ncbi:MAG: molybdenum cofactor biosynthesis protein MoaE [Ignavibacteriae bacterium]|nr:molybdenum cofactor biosynthesis protein MoaE [Ignavibacteriota bacterium]
MKEKKLKNVFVHGEITPQKIAESIQSHSSKTDIGAHSIFLGQVRKDIIDGKEVEAIEYSCYEEMASEVFNDIREEAFKEYALTCLHIYHSLGIVEAGKICLFVFTSSRHRAIAIEACSSIVEQIKVRVPIWGKEIFEDSTYVWKQSNI